MNNTTPKNRLNVEMEDITKLIDLLKSSGINEIEITQGETGIRLRKDAAPQPNQATNQASVAANIQPNASQISENTHSDDTQPTAENNQIDGQVMTSPMVGTFYHAPSPDASPYVNVGDRVKKGQTICIIEAMKTMNQIEAEKDGKLQDILVNDAQPVEYGEPLFVIQ